MCVLVLFPLTCQFLRHGIYLTASIKNHCYCTIKVVDILKITLVAVFALMTEKGVKDLRLHLIIINSFIYIRLGLDSHMLGMLL